MRALLEIIARARFIAHVYCGFWIRLWDISNLLEFCELFINCISGGFPALRHNANRTIIV